MLNPINSPVSNSTACVPSSLLCKFTNLSHMHKLKKIGFVMISGELSRTNFRKFFLLDTDKQAALAVMPPVKVNDFLDLHPDLAKESREKIRTMVAAFFPHAKQTGDDDEDHENEQPEQLSFTVDLFSGDEGVEKIYDITRSDRLDVCGALALTQNGTTICRAVTDWIAKHPEDFDDEGDLAYLEEKYQELQDASNKMLAVITEKKRKQLQLTGWMTSHEFVLGNHETKKSEGGRGAESVTCDTSSGNTGAHAAGSGGSGGNRLDGRDGETVTCDTFP